MKLSSLQEDEEIIQLLEEIDSNFSEIRLHARELKMKIAVFAGKTKQIAENCNGWMRFFETEKNIDFSPFSDLHLSSLKTKELENSPNNLNYTAPKNPFLELETSELLNRSVIKHLKENVSSEILIPDEQEKLNDIKDETFFESDEKENIFKPFNLKDFPAIFQKEQDLTELYKFIELKKCVTFDQIASHFKDISTEKLQIFITLLTRKKYIKSKNQIITFE